MFKRRFIPYIVGVCVVVLLGIVYLSYVKYKTDQNFKAFMADAQVFNRSIEEGHGHSSHNHTHHSQGQANTLDSEKTDAGEQIDSGEEHPYFVGQTPDGEYSYNIAGRLYASNKPMSQRSIEIEEWILTGKMPPSVKEAIRDADQVIQTVVTPDGKLHTVVVPRDSQYEEGDAILQSELDPRIMDWSPVLAEPLLAQTGKYWLHNKLIIDGVDYFPPEEYYSIEDPYERQAYFNKFTWSIEYDISMAEVEKRIAAGELPQSLSESDKRMVDEIEKQMERYRMLAKRTPKRSDKPPVKVSFLPDEGKDALPGWKRKEVGNLPSGSGKTEYGGTPPATDSVPERESNEDTRGAPVRSDVPVSPSDLPDMVKPQFPPSVADIEKQLTPEGIEAELSKGVSPDSFNKAQQLIDQYGTEEGLRRLREMDPEAARRFESDKSRPGREPRPAPSRNTPDGGQSESGSKD